MRRSIAAMGAAIGPAQRRTAMSSPPYNSKMHSQCGACQGDRLYRSRQSRSRMDRPQRLSRFPHNSSRDRAQLLPPIDDRRDSGRLALALKVLRSDSRHRRPWGWSSASRSRMPGLPYCHKNAPRTRATRRKAAQGGGGNRPTALCGDLPRDEPSQRIPRRHPRPRCIENVAGAGRSRCCGKRTRGRLSFHPYM